MRKREEARVGSIGRPSDKTGMEKGKIKKPLSLCSNPLQPVVTDPWGSALGLQLDEENMGSFW